MCNVKKLMKNDDFVMGLYEFLKLFIYFFENVVRL